LPASTSPESFRKIALRSLEMELRPAPHELARVQHLVVEAVLLVVEAVLLEGGDVALDVAGADLLRVPLVGGPYDEAAGLEEDLDARLLLQRVPGLVGVGGQGGVLGLVLRKPDDARVVLRGAAVGAEPELLEAEHRRPELPGEPVEGRRTQPAAPQTIALYLVSMPEM
jgi:hypothetical protein